MKFTYPRRVAWASALVTVILIASSCGSDSEVRESFAQYVPASDMAQLVGSSDIGLIGHVVGGGSSFDRASGLSMRLLPVQVETALFGDIIEGTVVEIIMTDRGPDGVRYAYSGMPWPEEDDLLFVLGVAADEEPPVEGAYWPSSPEGVVRLTEGAPPDGVGAGLFNDFGDFNAAVRAALENQVISLFADIESGRIHPEPLVPERAAPPLSAGDYTAGPVLRLANGQDVTLYWATTEVDACYLLIAGDAPVDESRALSAECAPLVGLMGLIQSRSFAPAYSDEFGVWLGVLPAHVDAVSWETERGASIVSLGPVSTLSDEAVAFMFEATPEDLLSGRFLAEDDAGQIVVDSAG